MRKMGFPPGKEALPVQSLPAPGPGKKNQKSPLNPSLHLETWNTEAFLPPC